MNQLITIEYYPVDSDIKPYYKWFNKLDANARSIIARRFSHVRKGTFGDHHPIKNSNGVSEFRFHICGGLRIYYGQEESVVIILWGGIKDTQYSDIERAKEYWFNHNFRNSNEQKERYKQL